MNDRGRGILAIVASAFGFAVMAACVRLCDDYGSAIPCFEKSFFRNLIALLIAGTAFLRGRRSVASACANPGGTRSVASAPASARAWWGQLPPSSWCILGTRCVLGTIGIFANFYALSKIPIADGQTLNKTAPFFTVVFAWAFLRERAGARQLFAVALAFLGTVLVAKPGFAGADSFPLTMGLLGGACAGGAYAAVRALGARKVDSTLIVFAFSAFSCLVSIPFTWAVYVPLTGMQFLILAGAGLGAALGQFGITAAYRLAAPREIAVYDYTNILFTAALGFLLFGQVSDVLAILGMVVIVVAAMLR